MSRIRTRVDTVFSYSELAPRAQRHAREQYSQTMAECFGPDDLEHVITDAVQCGALMGIDLEQRTARLMNGNTRAAPSVYWSDLNGNGSAYFDSQWRASACDAAKLRAHAPMDKELHAIADQLQALASAYPGAFGSTETGRRDVMGYAFDSGEECDDIERTRAEWDALHAEHAAHTDAFESAMRDFAHWIHSQLVAEYEYQFSDAAIAERMVDDCGEYLENGERA
jgi:hypothetical protein